MASQARLITPQGETIELTPEEYERVRAVLDRPRREPTRAETQEAIRNTYGKYAGGASLIEELQAERAAERARDAVKLARVRD